MKARDTLYKKIADGTFALNTGDEIARKLRLSKQEKSGLFEMLDSLYREGKLLRDSSFRYGTREQFGALEGKITGNERGFGFFVPDDKGKRDLFIPRRALNGALHGDKVLAFCVGGRQGDQGEVLTVLSHGVTQVVGVFHAGRGNGTLTPDERKFSEDVYIPAGKTMGCKNGMKAVARIFDYSRGVPEGEIIEILGQSGDFFVEENAIIHAHSLREEFPSPVLREAEIQAAKPISDLSGRLDLTGELVITVDGEDTRDIDDAISLTKSGNNYRLGVHIADVSFYVARGSALDNEALERGTSVYFPDRVLPMLPPALSNGICSLNEGERRYTLSCLMTISPTGKVLKKRIVPSVICSSRRMTYTDVTAIASGSRIAREKYSDLVEMIENAVALTKILKRRRENSGAVPLDVKETKILYADGLVSIPDYERTVSHEMIEQFMVLANESVAEIMTQAEMPFVYRVHERPSHEKALAFADFIQDLGVKARFDAENVAPTDFKAILDSCKNLPTYGVINRVMLRSMMKAFYSPENVGHFGLASACYCHFTSPIRRYPDLCIHRIIKDYLKNGAAAKEKHKRFVEEAAIKSSSCERNAESAERDVDALYIVKYMADKIGESYDAVISGVTSFGVFAQLKNTVEGLVPIETLPDDCYVYMEEKYMLRGTRNSYRIGQEVKVKVASVDWGARKVLFVLDGDRK